jgi:hypothetical protein
MEKDIQNRREIFDIIAERESDDILTFLIDCAQHLGTSLQAQEIFEAVLRKDC